MSEYQDGLIGLIIGDILGQPLNGISRSELLKEPVTGMISKKGGWGSPTAINLAISDLINKDDIEDKDVMERLLNVLENEHSTDSKIILGKTTLTALEKYKTTKNLKTCGGINLNDNGSGAIIRIYPIAYFAYKNKLKEKEILTLVRNTTSITHAHEINTLACYIYTLYLIFLLRGKDKHASLSMIQCCDYSSFKKEYVELFNKILKDSLKESNIDNINTNGYVVSSLEASLYVLLNSESYTQAVLGAINLGGEASTISSLVGCMAGILYGAKSIPKKWISSLKGQEEVEIILKKL